MEYRRIGLYGVNCAGKTSVTKKIEELNPLFKFIDGSKIINIVTGGRLSDFKKMAQNDKKHYREKAIELLISIQKNEKKHLIRDIQ